MGMLLSVPILLIKLRWLVKVKVVNAEKVRVERNRDNPVKKDTEVVRPKITVDNELDNNNINNTRLDNK